MSSPPNPLDVLASVHGILARKAMCPGIFYLVAFHFSQLLKAPNAILGLSRLHAGGGL